MKRLKRIVGRDKIGWSLTPSLILITTYNMMLTSASGWILWALVGTYIALLTSFGFSVRNCYLLDKAYRESWRLKGIVIPAIEEPADEDL